MRSSDYRTSLDGFSIENKGSLIPAAVGRLRVVGNCSTCGNPIYGPKEIPAGTTPDLHRTCACRTVTVHPLGMETKGGCQLRRGAQLRGRGGTMPRCNYMVGEHHDQVLHQLSAQTGTSMSEWVRRMLDYCTQPQVLNTMVPCLSGQIQIRAEGEK